MNWKIILAAGAIVFTGTLYAQTPDGETPANEGVCDGLVGHTPGLFGLCNAYCEAQDCDVIGGDSKSCTKILDNYNDKMIDGVDPEMPCLVSEAVSCPCFTYEEARLSFDGMYNWFDRTSVLFEGWRIFSVCGIEDVPSNSTFLAGIGHGIYGPLWPGETGSVAEEFYVEWSPNTAGCIRRVEHDGTYPIWVQEIPNVPRADSYDELRACFDILDSLIPEDQSVCNFGFD